MWQRVVNSGLHPLSFATSSFDSLISRSFFSHRSL